MRINNHPDVRTVCEPDYAKAADTAIARGAGAALIEIAETGRYDADYCLALCARLRREAPGCRLLLLCPEQDESSIAAAVAAKRNGQIDDFLFCDATTDYLESKLLAF